MTAVYEQIYRAGILPVVKLDTAEKAVQKMAELLMLPVYDNSISLFTGAEFEFMKQSYYGKTDISVSAFLLSIL